MRTLIFGYYYIDFLTCFWWEHFQLVCHHAHRAFAFVMMPQTVGINTQPVPIPYDIFEKQFTWVEKAHFCQKTAVSADAKV